MNEGKEIWDGAHLKACQVL